MMKQTERKHKGFTLIELVVAIGLLVMVVSLTGVIFRMSIETHRLSIANGEIMQKLRAFTDQLKQDFAGVRKNGQVGVYDIPHQAVGFFSCGDFVRHYDVDDDGIEEAIRGNMAHIAYLPAAKTGPHDPNVLLRRQTVLTADTQLQLPSLEPNAPAARRCFYDWVLDDTNDWATLPVDQNSLFSDPNGPEIFMMKGVELKEIDTWPKAGQKGQPGLKFQFRITDSKKLIKGDDGKIGRRFTYIVYYGRLPRIGNLIQ